MRTPSPSEKSAARIPNITNLRDKLNYGDTQLARCAAFTDDLRVFRRRYSTTGIRGVDLLDWKSPEHQSELKQMTTSFLDGKGYGEKGYGEIYWPTDPTAPNFNSLQYSEDSVFISQTMRQLIFRLNLQQYRNNKYKKKDIPARAPQSDIASPKVPATFDLPSAHYDVCGHHLQRQTPKRKLKPPQKPQPTKRSKIVILKTGIGDTRLANPTNVAQKMKRTSARARRSDLADLNDINQVIAVQEAGDDLTPDDACETRFNQRKNTGPDSESVERVIQPTLKRESPIPWLDQANSMPDSRIDPNLERLVSLPKSAIEFNYIVILSRTPIYSYKTWRPQGHFVEKSLSQLIHELPFDNKQDIKGLTIWLEGPGVAAEETLNCGEEARFDTTKGRLLRLVKMSRKNHNKANSGKALFLNFEIEAMKEDGGGEEDDDGDDDIEVF